MKPLASIALATLLAAAASTALAQDTPTPNSTNVTPPGFQMPAGEGCGADIARYRAVQNNDLSMGHVAKSVYNKIKAEIAAAEEECDKGHEAHARAMIVASKKRHGYPTDL
jgi:hypothetical protein